MRKERINQSKNPIIGGNIKRLRMEQNMRNVDVTAMLQLKGIKLSTSTLSKIERGTTSPPVDVLRALTAIFHCDYNALFYEEDSVGEKQGEKEGQEVQKEREE